VVCFAVSILESAQTGAYETVFVFNMFPEEDLGSQVGLIDLYIFDNIRKHSGGGG